jgi:branched-chain amino acid transport system permease protein
MVSALIQGVYLGAVLGLIALGLNIIYSSSRVINFAQGEFLVFGAVMAYEFRQALKVPTWEMVLAVIAGSILLGLVIERLIMLPVQRSGSPYAWIIATLALAIIFESVYPILFPSVTFRPSPFVGGKWRLGGGQITGQEILIVVVAVGIMVAYDQFLRRTVYGSAMRAVAHDPDASVTLGINSRMVIVATFVISVVITAVSGMLVAPTLFLVGNSGLSETINGFVAMVIGGVGSVRGALVGGLVVGMLDSMVSTVVTPQVGEIVIVAILAAILLVRPSGLFRGYGIGH